MATRAAASLAAKDNAELILLRESISAFTVRFEALELKVEALELSNGLKDTKIQALEHINLALVFQLMSFIWTLRKLSIQYLIAG